MRPRQAVGHVVEEGRDLGVDLGLAIDTRRGFELLGPRLLFDVQVDAQADRQQGQGRGHGLGQDLGPLRTAGDQDVHRRVDFGIGFVIKRANVGAHRIAGHLHLAFQFRRRHAQHREGAGDRVDLGHQLPVGAAQHRILFVNQGDVLARRRRQQRGKGRIATETDDRPRL